MNSNYHISDQLSISQSQPKQIPPQLQRAQIKLCLLQDKIKNYRQSKSVSMKQSNLKSQQNINQKIFYYPNLSEFITYFKQQSQGKDNEMRYNDENDQNLMYNDDNYQQNSNYRYQKINKVNRYHNKYSQNNQNNENDKNYSNKHFTINNSRIQYLQKQRQVHQKFSHHKSNTLQNLQSFYKKKNLQLDKKIQSLQSKKSKIIQDKSLLIKNNKQLEQSIILRKQLGLNEITTNIKDEIGKYKEKIQMMKKQIIKVEEDNSKINKVTKELRKNIQDCIKGQKNIIEKEMHFEKKYT